MAKPGSYLRWIMLVPLIISGIWFNILEKEVLNPDFIMQSTLDMYIPFTPAFVVPYFIWYVYVALTAFYLFWRSPDDFVKIAAFLALGMLIACTVYTAFPNGQALRPVLKPTTEPLTDMIYHLYRIDTPANCAPSIHVVYSVAAHAAIYHHNNSKQFSWINIISFIVSVLCILSTVFIKQHSVIDLFAGLILSAVLYLIIYKREILKRMIRLAAIPIN